MPWTVSRKKHLKGLCFGIKPPLPLRGISPKEGEKPRVMEDFFPLWGKLKGGQIVGEKYKGGQS